MKKTININLGGQAFTIDENAFELLHNYLEALKKKFKNEAERAEIMNDIEARIAEMFNQRLGTRKDVISTDDVEYVTGLMGKPEDIAGEEPAEESATTSGTTTTNTTYENRAQQPVTRRLFRDPDDAKIAGVISGLCHYLGIADPVWMRILVVLLVFFSWGGVILIYILLALIVPKAETSGEKLQMKGEPINISTIEKEVKFAAGKIGDTVRGSEGFFRRLLDLIVKVIVVFAKIVAACIMLGALVGLVGILIWFITGLIFGPQHFNENVQLFIDPTSMMPVFSIGLFLAAAAPLVAILYLGLKVLTGARASIKWLKWALLGAWVTGCVLLGITGVNVALGYKNEAIKKDTYYLAQPTGDTLHVQLADLTDKGWTTAKAEKDEGSHFFGTLIINGKNVDDDNNTLEIGRPDIQITESENDSFYIEQIVSSRGRTTTEAGKNAARVVYKFAQFNTVLNLSRHFELPVKGSKWRVQDMIIRIAVPKGKHVHFNGNIDEGSAVVKGNSDYNNTQFGNTTWVNEGGKIKCLDCRENDGEGYDDGHEIKVKVEMQADSLEKKIEKKMKKIQKKIDELNEETKEIN